MADGRNEDQGPAGRDHGVDVSGTDVSASLPEPAKERVAVPLRARPVNSGKYAVVMARDCGLFSLFTQVLTAVEAYPDRRISVFFNSACLYWIPDGWNGSRNVWEYYFEPLSDVHAPCLLGLDEERAMRVGVAEVEAMLKDDRIALVYTHRSGRTGMAGALNEHDRPFVKRIIDRHIRVKPAVQMKADKFFNDHMAGRRVVGLHYRGTDKHQELVTSVPSFEKATERTIADYLNVVDRLAPLSMVYLATDSQAAVEAAKIRLGDRLLHHPDWIRSSDDRPVHFGMDWANPAKQGEEAVIDWTLLSRCSFLVHGVSNFSAAVLLAAPDLPHYDVYRS